MADKNEDIPKPRRWYPYDPVGYWYNEPLDVLRGAKGKSDEPHVPTFALRMLKRLGEVGVLHTTDADAPDNVRLVHLDNGQVLWVRFDTWRTLGGYMGVEVVDAPRTDTAIIAAMVAWGADQFNFERLLETLRSSPAEPAMDDATLRETLASIDEKWAEDEEAALEETKRLFRSVHDRVVANLDRQRSLEHWEYLLALIRYYRPEFDDFSLQEQFDLLEKAQGYINGFLESLSKLQGFLEYGAPNRKLTRTVKEPDRDMQAAVYYDVDGQSYREIGRRMGIPLPPNSEIKGDHQTVRKMVDRGRHILEKTFGKEGWRERARAMRAEKVWWRSLSREERDREIDIVNTALSFDMSIDEARRLLSE